jgi:hypothetical protein
VDQVGRDAVREVAIGRLVREGVERQHRERGAVGGLERRPGSGLRPERGGGVPVAADRVGEDRAVDVVQPPPALRAPNEVGLVGQLAADLVRHADAARRRQLLEPVGEVDTEPDDVAAAGDRDLADVDADPEAERQFARVPNLLPGHVLLERDREGHRLGRARERGEDRIARRVDEPAAVVADERAEAGHRPFQTTVGPGLVARQVQTITLHVGQQDGRALASGFLRHRHLALGFFRALV